MSERKRQHTIPKSYLRAWCDPNTPAGQLPYIWRISKDGSSKKRKSPGKSFTQTDKYTIRLPTGRNLVIEETLGNIENDFARVLFQIRKRQALTPEDRARLCIFAAAMHARTEAMGQHSKSQMGNLHNMVVEMEKGIGLKPVQSLETAKLVDLAHQNAIATSLEFETPLLFRMRMSTFVTDDDVGFITSDNPCVWFNSELHKFLPAFRSPGLAQRLTEVTLPVTPHHLVLFSHVGPSGYIDVNQAFVDGANRLTRFHCDQEFVSWKGQTRPEWFDRDQKPDDPGENL
jgi:Protein of unknown function (DUF4238)